ncbi:carbamoyl phosphate synthase small subunit [Paenactinomyces guangxiensis]|uniref:Carbamoyl phosphate synthase small chain n=1 Tax=Paenactinomyces guangxiensis TaxID=1490290 RepID=A0A7W1WQR5_9BACL|nr:carbamoyl phosphate synthase small subunit [Paenactinomyces guangxiensis]MBA4494218.1 glutamine-hydrolyzing carbamoyl-phosphate synthase small subunit [Paenactinomyces guangxiensis]MBH8590714.1 glutamine-hydrolyzing carbamoyl-phosphate synthase small subunit [Paenactinomyces guangxiensis]
MKARLLLEDGTLFTGTSFGAEGQSIGEVVFNTSMTGYQEVLTDPSYCGQIITMTYPLIGNYGLSRDDYESLRPYAHGFIVREHAEFASNWRNEYSISYFLKEYGILGISGIDTRMLTRKIRLHGTMKGIITTGNEPLEELKERLNTPLMHDQVARVSTKSIHISPSFGKRVVQMDFGAKHNIQRELVERNCAVISVPYNTTAEEILRFRPDGVMLSNGPGDPKDVPEAIETIQQLLGKVPLFGICLGHQLLALACGADTEKMKFGHRGGNHPVKELATGRSVITSQNHGYAVSPDSVKGTELTVSHVALNDGTIEGLQHQKLPAFSVQYHPESAPGPLDSGYLFDRFIELMDSCARKGECNYA